MSKIGINIKINVNQIDKARLFQGQKGQYLDLTAFIDLDKKSEYGDNGTVSQSTTKEERENGMKMPIIGNTTVFFNTSQNQQQPQGQFSSDVRQAHDNLYQSDDKSPF